MAGIAGFEPANVGVKDRCLTAWRYPIINEMCKIRTCVSRGVAFDVYDHPATASVLLLDQHLM